MPQIFTSAASLAFFLVAALVSPFLTFLVARRQADIRAKLAEDKADSSRADTYGKIVEDAVNLKKQFQADYEALCQRLVDQDSHILVLRQRVLTLEAENHNLRLQIMAAGLASASISPPEPAPPTTPMAQPTAQPTTTARKRKAPPSQPSRPRRARTLFDPNDPIEEE